MASKGLEGAVDALLGDVPEGMWSCKLPEEHRAAVLACVPDEAELVALARDTYWDNVQTQPWLAIARAVRQRIVNGE